MEEDNGKVGEAVWGANPDNPKAGTDGEEATRVGAENIWLKMPTSEGKMIEVNLLQVINQLFIDMGHFDRRVRALEAEDGKGNIISV